MKITHVIFNLKTGGTELMLMDIMQAQQDMGADVSLLVINREHDTMVTSRVPRGVKLIQVNRPTGSRNPWWIARINMLLAASRPDVVHFHNDMSIGMVMQMPGVKYVGTVHDTGIKLRYTQKRLSRIFAISKSVKHDLEKRYWVHPTVVYNGIRVADITHRGDSPHPGKFHIVQVGRLMHEKKGQHLLLQAVAMLPPELRDIITIDFIGDGPSYAYLRDLAEGLGIASITSFLGNLDRTEVYDQLSWYDLFVQPSLYEGFGLTVAEAMAAKLPVLVSELEGPLEIVDNGRMGTTFHPDSPADLSNKIREIMTHYRAYLNHAHGDAYDYVSQHFDIATTASRYLEEYSRL